MFFIIVGGWEPTTLAELLTQHHEYYLSSINIHQSKGELEPISVNDKRFPPSRLVCGLMVRIEHCWVNYFKEFLNALALDALG